MVPDVDVKGSSNVTEEYSWNSWQDRVDMHLKFQTHGSDDSSLLTRKGVIFNKVSLL
jgi:hypothetical protein